VFPSGITKFFFGVWLVANRMHIYCVYAFVCLCVFVCVCV